MNKLFFTPIFATAVLVGCMNSSAPTSNSRPKVQVRIENGSPDKAVKSWWLLRDLVAEESLQFCQLATEQEQKSPARKFLSDIADGTALKRLTEKQHECTPTILSRDIKTVQVETETRAIVIANIKDVSPIPAGGVPDEHDQKYRANGFNYKYLLEKGTGGWKIAQIYEQDRYSTGGGDPWKAVFEENTKIYVPAYLYGVN